MCDDDGVADFDRLHGREHDGRAFLWAFDLLELDGEDFRLRPLLERKGALRRFLRRAPAGIQYTDHLDGRWRGDIRPCLSAGTSGQRHALSA